MSSDVQISKLALQHLGDRYDISDLDESSVEAEQSSLLYETVRDYTLRAHPWTFCKKYLTLVELSGTVPGGWTYMYAYPPDCLKIRYIRNTASESVHDRLKYEVALNGSDVKVILTDVEEPELVYTKRIEDTTKYDPEFILAFSYALGSRMAMALTGDKDLARMMLELADMEMAMAESSNEDEAKQEETPEAAWIDAR